MNILGIQINTKAPNQIYTQIAKYTRTLHLGVRPEVVFFSSSNYSEWLHIKVALLKCNTNSKYHPAQKTIVGECWLIVITAVNCKGATSLLLIWIRSFK